MAVKYQAYPEYKDSGVEWLNKLPVGWVSTTIKYGYEVTLGKMLQKERKSFDDQLKPYLKAINIQEYGVDVSQVEKMWFSPLELDSLGLTHGDVLISEGGDVGRSAIWREELPECYIQNAINRARPKRNQSSSFLFYWMYMLKHSGYVEIICNKATIAHYTVDKLENSPLFIPSDSEAEKIADFLDHETAKIDSLIEKQQQLITLLKEKRQAVISHAVTKGLNPDAPMRDSGVEWLGEVPEHWDIYSSKYLFPESKKRAELSDKQLSATQDYGVISQEKFMQLAGRRVVQLNRNQELRKRVDIGDFVISMRSFQGGLERAWDDGGIRSSYVVLKPALNIKRRYYQYLFKSIRYIQALQSTANFIRDGQDMNYQNFVLIDLPFPPLDEQRLIASFIKKEISHFDQLVEKASQFIALLQERRAALISAAVTGKIDVRNWQPPKLAA